MFESLRPLFLDRMDKGEAERSASPHGYDFVLNLCEMTEAGSQRIAARVQRQRHRPFRPNNCMMSALLSIFQRKPILTTVMIRWNV